MTKNDSQPQRLALPIVLIGMVGVLLLASFLYLTNLNAVSFWEDESWLAIGISGSPLDLWQFASERGVHPPLYFYIAYFLEPFTGDGELALRWMSGLVGLVGVAWTYRLGATLADRRTGLIAALLVTGSIFLVYFARLARHYTLFYTLSIATIWTYWRWRNDPTNRTWWFLLIVLQAANLYTHYFSAFIALTVALHSLFTKPLSQTRRVWLALFLSGVLFVPWIPSILTQLNSDFSDGLYYFVPDIPRILANFADRVTNANLALGIILSGLGIVALWRKRDHAVAGLLFIWIIITFLPIVLVNEFLFEWFIGRNMIYTLPAMMLLYALGLRMLWSIRWGKGVALVLCLGFVGYGVYVYEAFWPGTPDWRTLSERIATQASPTDQFIVYGETYSLDYYFQRYLAAEVDFDNMLEWQQTPETAPNLWLIDGVRNRIPERFVNTLPDNMQRTAQINREPIVAERYQQIPEEAAVIFEDQIALATDPDVEYVGQAGQTLVLDVWWQAVRMPDDNYSVSVQILGDAGVVAQADANFGGLDSQVLPIEVWSPDRRRIALPSDLPAGTYRIGITVYDWNDGNRRLEAIPQMNLPPPIDQLVLIATLRIP